MIHKIIMAYCTSFEIFGRILGANLEFCFFENHKGVSVGSDEFSKSKITPSTFSGYFSDILYISKIQIF